MQDDLRELIASLNANQVEYIVVGSHVVAFYARPRYSEDLDLFLNRTEENKVRLDRALREFGIPLAPHELDKLFTPGKSMAVLGHPPDAVDLMNFVTGLEFDSAWKNKNSAELFGEQVFILSKEDFIKAKRATARPKDLADIEAILEANP